MKSFSSEGQTERRSPTSECELVLQQTSEWLDSGPLNPALFHCVLLCRPGKKNLLPDCQRGFSQLELENHSYGQPRHTWWHIQACVHIHRLSHTHIINSPSATYSTFTLISNTEPRIRAKCDISPAYFTSTSLNSSVDGSGKHPAWYVINGDLSGWGMKGTSPFQSVCTRKVEEAPVLTSHQKQLFLLWANTAQRFAERVFWGMEGILRGGQLWGMQGFYILLWNFFPTSASSNNNFTVRRKSPQGKLPADS